MTFSFGFSPLVSVCCSLKSRDCFKLIVVPYIQRPKMNISVAWVCELKKEHISFSFKEYRCSKDLCCLQLAGFDWRTCNYITENSVA